MNPNRVLNQLNDVRRALAESSERFRAFREEWAAELAVNLAFPDLPSAEGDGAKFNRTDDDKIEWAAWTWNPVTGCLNGCAYCYARPIAERLYPERFAPTFRSERLSAPHRTPVPARAATEPGWRNVFTVSMGDLFGDWVPQLWIDAVIGACLAAPQWNFLFLTKFPTRLAEVDWPSNCWAGATVDTQARVSSTEEAFRRVNAPVKFLSCEPLREPLRFSDLGLFDWVIIGAQSATKDVPEFQPSRAWVDNLIKQARAGGCRVYVKPNLCWPLGTERPREYPGSDRTLPHAGPGAGERRAYMGKVRRWGKRAWGKPGSS